MGYRYYRPMEWREESTGERLGIWHYTVTQDGETRPIGYCALGCEGHETAEEAIEHYRQWLLDKTAQYTGFSSQPRDCAECGSPTHLFAFTVQDGYPGNQVPLCIHHCNRAFYEQHLKLLPLVVGGLDGYSVS